MSITNLIPGLGEVGTVLSRFSVVRQLGIDNTPLRRLFLIECECNLSLIDCLRLEDKEAGQSGPAYWKIASSLETEVLEAILGSGDEESKVFKSLKSVPLLSPDAGEQADEELREDDDDGQFISEKLRRLYVNAFAVRTAARVFLEIDDPIISGMRELRFRTRLKNLRQAYIKIAKGLRDKLGKDAA